MFRFYEAAVREIRQSATNGRSGLLSDLNGKGVPDAAECPEFGKQFDACTAWSQLRADRHHGATHLQPSPAVAVSAYCSVSFLVCVPMGVLTLPGPVAVIATATLSWYFTVYMPLPHTSKPLMLPE